MSDGTILLVEDDDDIREVMSLALQAHGYRTASARDGLEAWELLRTAPAPALVLLDLMLPRLSGPELLERLRKDGRLGHVPVVVLSGNTQARTTARRLGAVDCLVKPIDLVELLTTVGRYAALHETQPHA